MTGKLNTLVKSTGLLLCISSAVVNAQILQDTSAMNLVRKDIDYIYNLEFDNAIKVYTEIARLYPDHPILSLLKGMMEYWENYPLLISNPSHASFEEDMRECIKLSEGNNKPDFEAEYLLADLCARGMLLTYYEDNNIIAEVIHLTIGTYRHLKRSFNFTSVCADLFYFTGIYNYYREAYPKIYPVYKPLALLFPPGDMETGIKELQMAASSSMVMRAESCSLLAWIYIDFENKLPQGLYYCKLLSDQYPGNSAFLEMYINCLLLSKQYDEAEKLISASYEKPGNNYFQAQLTIYEGILQEKKYHNYKLAQDYYNKGINDISLFGKYGNENAAYAYFGLSRISETGGEKKASKMFRKAALKLADFKKNDFDN